ncbi:MAG: T9SS type A sorting domain-containing protein [Leptolyngbya sp. SIO1D8]|nr:T9SS type A sorting domain-containing protein [Leptolyngbya sp. SIO1D8]
MGSILSPQKEKYEVSLHHLNPGLYLVRFASQQGNYLRKLIKH